MAARVSVALALILLAGLLGCNPPAAAQEPNNPRPLEQTGPVPVRAFVSSSKYGFIDHKGKIVLKPKYDDAQDFYEGLALVRQGKKALCIDKEGRIQFALPDGTSTRRHFSEGRMWFMDDEKRQWGLCDAKGSIIISPKYDDVLDFSEGFAAVNLGAQHIGFTPWRHGGKWGFINTRGEVVVPLQFESVHSYSEGLAQVTNDKRAKFIDRSAKTVLEIGDSHVGDFRAGVAPLYVDKSDHWDTDFIDRKGKKQFTIEGYASEYCEGLALVSVHQKSGGDLYGYIDRQGKFVIEPKFIEAHSFSEGLAGVALKKAARWQRGEEWGYIDKTGALKIEPKFNETRDFRNGLAAVHIGGERENRRHVGPVWTSGEWWLVDREGRKLQRPW